MFSPWMIATGASYRIAHPPIDAETVEIILNSGSGICLISGGLAAELQEKVSGVELTRPFEGKARVRVAFGHEHTVNTHTVPFTLTRYTARREVQFEVPYLVLPGERPLIFRGRWTLN